MRAVSNPTGLGRPAVNQPRIPKGDVLGTYDSYAAAQEVVDHLAKADFDVEHLSIVGSDLKSVERVTGRGSWGRAALGGALSGIWLGLFFGLLYVLFLPNALFFVLLFAMLIGAGFGILFGLVTYAITRRNRDFSSTQQIIVSSYQVIIDPEFTAKAQQVLAQQPAQD